MESQPWYMREVHEMTLYAPLSPELYEPLSPEMVEVLEKLGLRPELYVQLRKGVRRNDFI